MATTPIRRLDQIKALAHPLRLRIFEALSSAARTPKQVAELLGRKPTGLYHHVRVLEAARLIRPTETRKKRGTTEQYYRAVADEIRVDPSVFSRRRAGIPTVLIAVLGTTLGEVHSLRRPADPVVALRLRVPLSRTRVGELEKILQKWAASAGGPDAVEYALTVVAYPHPEGPGRRQR
jgi:DNA-binding transcriptional ArsR family regulator